jgi:hypothetical protein
VRGRRFVTLWWREPYKVAITLSLEEQDLLLAACPLAVERAPGAWGLRGHPRLNLAAADDATVRSVVTLGMASIRAVAV